MSAVVKGKQIIWGVPSGVGTEAAKYVSGGGIALSFAISRGGATTPIGDEDDDIVTRVDHAFENKVTLEVQCVSGTALPAKGAEITTLGTLDSVTFGTGRTFIDDAKVDYANSAGKKISISATHYPAMAADA
jgi:hypothetical protein